MNDIEMSIRMIKEAEAYLAGARAYLENLQIDVQNCKNLVEKKKLQNSLEQDRLRFSQLYKDVVLFKASYGIFTEPPEHIPTYTHKRLE